ncbi:ROK family protein [Candidatus Woesearchaeota archaeon]|nr:ROK family protein [Candidatus Woesearchaeota archaeon]
MRHIIGIDVGGSKIEGILINEKGKILDKVRIQTPATRGKTALIDEIVKVARKLWTDPVYGVGVGIPGPVDEKGVVSYLANIKGANNLNIKRILTKKLGVEVRVENDSNLFALAESTFGAGKKYPNMMGLIVGTGIGSGIIINNIVYSGRYGGAGEIGHNIVDTKNLQDLEYFCSGPGILRLYKNAGGKSVFNETKEVFKATKDSIAVAVISKVHELLAQAFSQVINTLNVELIVVGGGVSNSLDFSKLNKRTKNFVFKPLQKTFKIIKYQVGESSGSLGAAALFFD